jgi:large subunit ribosomal protein L33
MAKAKNAVKLISTAVNPKTGKPTGTFYVTKKNPKKASEKMKFWKYDPVVREHVEFKEGKIK